ncbi:hypothetical protein FIU28_08555 [Tardiphaga sp. vice154]|uniref:hypothetical protein n=1 Tax=Tardiphaga sp. vice154 TaxID=2592814 RepID=UPI001161D409|nr:hypothetical protein [Tardiphaga sp. vice154]QDM21160.1 hypothetical protein FIU28_08555 [Tardiphaga sp. vice154]
MTLRLDVPIDQSPVPAAVDAYYQFLVDLFPPGPRDRLAIFGTCLEFDITEKSRLYNDFVVRAFADRSVRVSPVPGQAAGDFADRYSTRYTDMVRLIIQSLDSELSPNDQAQIDRHQIAIVAISNDRDHWLQQVDDDWARKMQQLGIDPRLIDTDENTRRRYYDERVMFLTERRYAQRLWGSGGFNSNIRDREVLIGAIRRRGFPDDDYAELYNIYTAIVDEMVIRPRRPDLEIAHGWDEYTIQDPRHFGLPAVFDIAPGLQSIVDPRTILRGSGARDFSVSTKTTITNAHDTAWNASASGSYMVFFRGEINSSNESHFRQSISRIRKISVGFEHLGELQVMRDRWFSSTVFTDNERVKDFLKKHPALAERLSLLTTGVIVGRGLTLTLQFSDINDVQQWGSSSTSGSGGVNVYGYQLGGRGGGSSSYNNHTINTVDQTVTFKDDGTVCRLIGLRVTPVNPEISFEDVGYNSRPIWDIPDLQAEALAALGQNSDVGKEAIISTLRKRRRGGS